jgi:hypothetical protein
MSRGRQIRRFLVDEKARRIFRQPERLVSQHSANSSYLHVMKSKVSLVEVSITKHR